MLFKQKVRAGESSSPSYCPLRMYEYSSLQLLSIIVQGSELPEQHFLIVGGGIAGLTSAYMLLSAGHKVRVQ